MMNYACDLSQSETEKYFEQIIRKINCNQFVFSRRRPIGEVSLTTNKRYINCRQRHELCSPKDEDCLLQQIIWWKNLNLLQKCNYCREQQGCVAICTLVRIRLPEKCIRKIKNNIKEIERQCKRKEGEYEGLSVERGIWLINSLSDLANIFFLVYGALYLKMIDGAIH